MSSSDIYHKARAEGIDHGDACIIAGRRRQSKSTGRKSGGHEDGVTESKSSSFYRGRHSSSSETRRIDTKCCFAQQNSNSIFNQSLIGQNSSSALTISESCCCTEKDLELASRRFQTLAKDKTLFAALADIHKLHDEFDRLIKSDGWQANKPYLRKKASMEDLKTIYLTERQNVEKTQRLQREYIRMYERCYNLHRELLSKREEAANQKSDAYAQTDAEIERQHILLQEQHHLIRVLNEQKRVMLDNLQALNSSKNEKVEILQKTIDNINAENKRMATECKLLKSDQQRLKEELLLAEIDLEIGNSENAHLNDIIYDLKEQLVTQKDMVKCKEIEIQNLNIEFKNNLRGETDADKIHDLCLGYHDELNAKNNEIDNLKSAQAQLQHELNTLSNFEIQNQQQAAHIEELNAAMETLNCELADLKQSDADKEQQIFELQKSLEKSKFEHETTKEELLATRTKFEITRNQLIMLQEQFNKTSSISDSTRYDDRQSTKSYTDITSHNTISNTSFTDCGATSSCKDGLTPTISKTFVCDVSILPIDPKFFNIFDELALTGKAFEVVNLQKFDKIHQIEQLGNRVVSELYSKYRKDYLSLRDNENDIDYLDLENPYDISKILDDDDDEQENENGNENENENDSKLINDNEKILNNNNNNIDKDYNKNSIDKNESNAVAVAVAFVDGVAYNDAAGDDDDDDEVKFVFKGGDLNDSDPLTNDMGIQCDVDMDSCSELLTSYELIYMSKKIQIRLLKTIKGIELTIKDNHVLVSRLSQIERRQKAVELQQKLYAKMDECKNTKLMLHQQTQLINYLRSSLLENDSKLYKNVRTSEIEDNETESGEPSTDLKHDNQRLKCDLRRAKQIEGDLTRKLANENKTVADLRKRLHNMQNFLHNLNFVSRENTSQALDTRIAKKRYQDSIDRLESEPSLLQYIHGQPQSYANIQAEFLMHRSIWSQDAVSVHKFWPKKPTITLYTQTEIAGTWPENDEHRIELLNNQINELQLRLNYSLRSDARTKEIRVGLIMQLLDQQNEKLRLLDDAQLEFESFLKSMCHIKDLVDRTRRDFEVKRHETDQLELLFQEQIDEFNQVLRHGFVQDATMEFEYAQLKGIFDVQLNLMNGKLNEIYRRGRHGQKRSGKMQQHEMGDGGGKQKQKQKQNNIFITYTQKQILQLRTELALTLTERDLYVMKLQEMKSDMRELQGNNIGAIDLLLEDYLFRNYSFDLDDIDMDRSSCHSTEDNEKQIFVRAAVKNANNDTKKCKSQSDKYYESLLKNVKCMKRVLKIAQDEPVILSKNKPKNETEIMNFMTMKTNLYELQVKFEQCQIKVQEIDEKLEKIIKYFRNSALGKSNDKTIVGVVRNILNDYQKLLQKSAIQTRRLKIYTIFDMMDRSIDTIPNITRLTTILNFLCMDICDFADNFILEKTTIRVPSLTAELLANASNWKLAQN